MYVNNADAFPVSILIPSSVTGTTPEVALGGSIHTSVFSLQRVVDLATVSPKTQLSIAEGWKLAPSTVTSIPPNVGPDEGIKRWI